MNNINRLKELTITLNKVEDNLKNEKIILEFILENTTDGYWDWNMVTNYKYLSPKLKAQLGYTDKSMDNSPDSWRKHCNPEDLKKITVKMSKHIAGNIEDFSHKLRFTHRKGHEILILCRGKIVDYDDDGSPTRMIGTHVIID